MFSECNSDANGVYPICQPVSRRNCPVCGLQLLKQIRPKCREQRGVFVFSSIGEFVNRAWLVLLVGWFVLAAALYFTAPAWSTVAQDGEFAFLPDDAPSRRADKLFNQAFPQDLLSSSIVVVVS